MSRTEQGRESPIWRRDGRCYIIAEAGVNHDGDPRKAERLADIAKEAGADAVKFQSFRASDLLRRDALKPAYQRRSTPVDETQYEMLERLELSPETEASLVAHCRDIGIDYMSTPYDLGSLDRLLALGMPTIKIASCDLTFLPLIQRAARSGRPTILSTGASTFSEIEAAVRAFQHAGGSNMALLHCTTAYPCPPEALNLLAIGELQKLGLPVGFSDHSVGTAISVAARTLGACIVEKHFTLDPAAQGPDHAASLSPQELHVFVTAIRTVDIALGDGRKRVLPIEEDARALMRRSIVASRDLAAGDIITSDDLAFKRPGDGVSPMYYEQFLRARLVRDVRKDELLKPTDVISTGGAR